MPENAQWSGSSLTAQPSLSRRSWLKSAAAFAGAAAFTRSPADAAATSVEPDFRIRRTRIKQSIMDWTFDPMPTPELANHCKAIGLVAMEGIDPKQYPRVKELGLAVSLVGSHGFGQGPFNPVNHEVVYPSIMRAIVDMGYNAYVAQEFISTWPDKVAALRHAAKVCDV